MSTFRWKTVERRIGIIGPRWCGKTVLLTSLINHLKFHDPLRFKLGAANKYGEVSHYKEITDTPDVRKPGSLSWFDYEGYRNQFVQNGKWPAATKDISQYVCEFERSDWTFNRLRLHLFDLPGERVNDIPMITGEKDAKTAYAAWSDRTCRRLEKDLTTGEYFQPFFELARRADASVADVVHRYKVALAKSRLAYRPYITPSTFLLDRDGQRIKGTDSEILAKTRYCGLSPEEEFVPLPADSRTTHPEWVEAFVGRFAKYQEEVILPVVSSLKTCHALVIMVDVLAILGHGPGMYNDYRQLVGDLLAALDPKDTTLDLVLRNVYETLLPVNWRRSWISRIAFVAPKTDRIPFEDRARVRSLMEQLVRHEAKNCRGITMGYFPVAAVLGARENQQGRREMLGSTLYDADGTPLTPGAERKFSVPPVPDVWPEQGWKPGDFIFPDVYPRVSPLSNCPTEQVGLDELFNFLSW
ncbi:YcjX family protein [Zavarzinella formosa]|uniref:YcjX family protein n=1 Tax=Zavarzinella formosa TaxID=360055 RepID=UPI0003627168|nr:YcjX family protein [Zavarzinella formosa]